MAAGMNFSKEPRVIKDLPEAFRISMATVTVLYTILILITNVLVIIVFAKAKDFQNTTGFFYISLAVADLGMGFIIPLYTYTMYYGKWPYGIVMCKISAYVRCALVCITIWHLFYLTLDTFLAVFRPFHHKEILTCRKGQLMIAFSWLSSFALFTLPFFGFGEYKYLQYNGYCLYQASQSAAFTQVAAAYVFPALVAIYVLNGWLWCIAGRKSFKGPAVDVQRLALTREQIGQNKAARRRNWRAAKTILLILIFFTCTGGVMYILQTTQSFTKVTLNIYMVIIGGYCGLPVRKRR